MALTSYTSYADIRAALGVSEKDLADQTLALPLYSNHLAVAMARLAPGLATQVDAALAASAPTDPQKQLRVFAQLYATSEVARFAAGRMPMFAPQQVSDGKASMARFGDSPYKQLLATLELEVAQHAEALAATFREITATARVQRAPRTLMATSTGYDPVTGL